MTYAQTTTVSTAKTLLDIREVLGRYGAAEFGMAEDANPDAPKAMIAFRIEDPLNRTKVAVRMTLPLPAKTDQAFQQRPYRGYHKRNTPEQAEAAWEQACRSRWRSLFLVIKAKLEACASGISTVEREFLPDVVTGDGRTVGEVLRPQLAEVYGGQRQPRLLN